MLEKKLNELKAMLRRMQRVAVAYSGGVDSAFLLSVAHEVLGDDMIAVTVHSAAFPEKEYAEAVAYCRAQQIRQVICDVNPMEIEGFAQNPPDRCYICKKHMFQCMQAAAEAEGISYIVEGSNLDDNQDYRPGHRAIQELGIQSPLRAANLSKAEIRLLSRQRGLPTWNKPSYACLASRLAYGEEITGKKLNMIEQAENLLMSLGYTQMRVRMHGMMARIELLPEDIGQFMDGGTYKAVSEKLKQLGFTYVTLDLQGFRSGSMNEVLQKN